MTDCFPLHSTLSLMVYNYSIVLSQFLSLNSQIIRTDSPPYPRGSGRISAISRARVHTSARTWNWAWHGSHRTCPRRSTERSSNAPPTPNPPHQLRQPQTALQPQIQLQIGIPSSSPNTRAPDTNSPARRCTGSTRMLGLIPIRTVAPPLLRARWPRARFFRNSKIAHSNFRAIPHPSSHLWNMWRILSNWNSFGSRRIFCGLRNSLERR